MKRLSIILVLVFAIGMLVSSCNKKACPAYRTSADTEQAENKT